MDASDFTHKTFAADLAHGQQFVRHVPLRDAQGYHAGYGRGTRIERLIDVAKSDAGAWVFDAATVWVRPVGQDGAR